MSRILTASDIEACTGKRLMLAKGERLTPLARDRAKELGVEVVVSDAPAALLPLPLAGEGGGEGRRSGHGGQPPALTQTLSQREREQIRALPAAVPTSGAAAPAVRSTGTRMPPLPPSGAMYRRHALGPQGSAGQRGGRPKVGVVGAGHVGAMTALRLAESDLFGSVTLVDVVPGLAAGLALDIWHGAGLNRFTTLLEGSDDLAALRGAEYIVITAGKPRQPGMSRTDLTAVNGAVIESVAKAIRQHAPNAVLVVVTNPLEEMTHLAALHSGFPDERVLGMAGVLDSARFCSLVGLTGRCAPRDVRAIALGSHGPEMVIPLSQAFIGEQPIEQLLDAATLSAIVERTRESGGEVVKLLQKGSAYFTPAESAAAMVRAMASDSGEVLAACVRSRKAYGTPDTRVGLPVRLGRRGVKEIVTLALRTEEQQALREAAERIAARIAELGPRA
jgi:malate dehydrogenase